MRKPLRLLVVVVIVALAADQLVQHTVLADGRLLGHWVIPFDPPLFTDWQKDRLADYEAIVAGDEVLREKSLFDPDLGWCPRPHQSFGGNDHDWAATRMAHGPLARTKPPERRRIAVVGGSFVQGAEVEAHETWIALLGEAHPELEFANLGMAGYGLDQAYLRFRRDALRLEPDEVWMGFMPTATMRTTTHFPPVHRHWSTTTAFKPMLTLDAGGALVHVPSPARDFAEAVRLLHDQRAFLDAVGEHDRWVRRTPAAFEPAGTSWTHYFATSRLAVTWLESGDRIPDPFLRDPESHLRRLFHAILTSFHAQARAAGLPARVLVLPSRRDLETATGDEAPYWRGLLEDVRAAGVECLDLTEDLLSSGMALDPEAWMPARHYGPELNRVVAEAVDGRWLR